jgi:hypothetical protein
MMFFAGVWLPREAMAPALRTVSDLTPLGSAVHAMDISMLAGRFPPLEPLLVMGAWAVIFGWLSGGCSGGSRTAIPAAAGAGCPRFEKGARGK